MAIPRITAVRSDDMKKPLMKQRADKADRRSPGLLRIAALLSVPLLAFSLSGCVPKAMYDKDVKKANANLIIARERIQELEAAYEAQARDKGRTVSVLTDRYIELQEQNKGMTRRLNSFRDELLNLQRDIAELKLVITRNMEKIRSSMANEMLIKLIDMEHNVGVLLKKEAEPEPLPADVLKDIERAREMEKKSVQQPQGGEKAPE